MSETNSGRRKYRTTNWKTYNAALKARGDLSIWLNKDMQWRAPASGKRGRNQTFSDAAIQFCLTIKCLFGLPLRQTLGLVQSLLKMAGLPWAAPDYSTMCRRQKGLDVQVHYRPSSNGLHMLADSTGLKFLVEGEWKTKKHGAERRRQWRKVHLGIDAENMQIRAMVVTTNEVGDSPVAAGLLSQIPSHEIVASFTGDGAYDTKDVHGACHHRKAIPVIPPRKGARLRKGLAFANRNEAVKACKKLGRTIWKRWSGYHHRSLVETKMNCFKRLGEKVMARTFERQVAELNVRASILNRFTELGTPQTVAVA